MKRFMWVAANAMALMFMLMTITACKSNSAPVHQGVKAIPSAPVNPTNSNILTADDISKVTGLSGVVLVPYEPSKGAGGVSQLGPQILAALELA
ncbi:MAG: hypothetical protein ABSC77_14330 [Terracidiphilus sp.]|jgi:hypothetical protein